MSEKPIQVERYRAPGQGVNEDGIGCRVIDTASGSAVHCHMHGSWIENKRRALKVLAGQFDLVGSMITTLAPTDLVQDVQRDGVDLSAEAFKRLRVSTTWSAGREGGRGAVELRRGKHDVLIVDDPNQER